VLSVVIWDVEPAKSVSEEPYIEDVFENDLVGLDAASTLAAAEANEHALATGEIRRLQLAAHWADLHAGDAVPQSRTRGVERPIRLGGEGTPTVAEFAPAELGCVLRMSDGSASRLIADALDLRHRLPLIWAVVVGGQALVYQARHIAKASRHLTAEQAGFVDARIAPSLGAVSFGRLQTLVEAAIIDADPDGAEQRAAAAAQERFVRLGRSSEHGLKLIIARATAGDAIWFKAVIDRIADILGRQGDTDTVDVRRSKAIGILAQPAEACRLLCEHQNDDWDGPGEPEEDVETGSSEDSSHRALEILPPPFNPDKARPRAIIYVHVGVEALTAGTGIARVENVGPIMLSQIQTLLGNRCTISLKPVIDLPAGHIAVDSYEIPASLREQLLLRYPADVFPYANIVRRSVDIDHTIRYVSLEDGGPPGQTRIGNLGPHVRYHHRVKTFGGWQVRQPEPGSWLWRTPHGWICLVNATGSHPLGNTEFAHAIWRTAADPAKNSRGDPKEDSRADSELAGSRQ
jgi:Domain of unknown function (DUF222)